MPRKRKTATGYDAQDIKSVSGQRYGEGVKQQEMQRAMPAPNVTGPAARVPPASQPQQAASPPATPEDLMQIAARMQGQAGLLSRPTNRPNEPITAGLPVGPGPGREALQMRRGSPLGDNLRDIARLSGDPLLADLAARSGL